MYEHNKDRLVYTIVFYLLLAVAVNSFLVALENNTAFSCS